jgi:hypothetical protein
MVRVLPAHQLVLLFAIALAAAAATRSAPPDTAVTPMSWVVGRDEPRAGDVVEAWLVVPADHESADAAASVRILSPSDADVWLRDAAQSCRDAESADRTEHRGRVERDTVLFACVRPRDVGTTRLVAVRRVMAGTATRQEIATSPAIIAHARYTIGAGWLAVLTAAMGFLTGILAHVIQARWDRRQSGQRDERELRLLVAKHLVEELRENLRRVHEFLRSTTGPAPDMVKAEYNVLLGDDGLVSYLTATERTGYWNGVQKVYELMETYTDYKNTNRLDEARATARDLQKRLTNHLRQG